MRAMVATRARDMLEIKVVNDTTGTNEKANYIYMVTVNFECIGTGRIEGHNRNDGWAALLKMIAEQELAEA